MKNFKFFSKITIKNGKVYLDDKINFNNNVKIIGIYND